MSTASAILAWLAARSGLFTSQPPVDLSRLLTVGEVSTCRAPIAATGPVVITVTDDGGPQPEEHW